MRLAIRWAAVVSAVAAYIVAFASVADTMGTGAGVLSLIPILLAGALLGSRWGATLGVATALLTDFLVHALLPAVDSTPLDFIYILISAGVGAGLGYMKELRDDARANAERARRLFESNPLAAWLVDPQRGTVVDINVAAIRQYGYSREEWTDKPLADLTLPEDAAGLATMLSHSGAQPMHLEMRHIKADGGVILVNITCTSILLDGRPLLYSVAEDVTNRRRAEELMRRNDRLMALGTLVAGVAHEINNPLTYMRGNIELAQMALDDALAHPDLSEPVRVELDEMVRAHAAVLGGVDQIARITRSLRRVARRGDAQREPVELRPLVESTVMLANARLDDRLDLRIDVPEGLLVFGVEGELSQVVLNLLFNAADAVSDRPRPEVRVRGARQGPDVVLEVEDNGRGIAQEHHARIFVPFHTTKAEGTGLGLSLSRTIATEHGGSLDFDSKPGRTVFRLVLPALQVAAPLTR